MKKKKCSTCENRYEATTEYFYRVRSNSTGLSAECKTCFDLAPKKARGRKKERNYDEGHTCWMNGDNEIYML